MTLNKHSCNGHSRVDLSNKITENRCKICFKLLINWKGVKLDHFVPICSSQNTRLNNDAKKLLVKEKYPFNLIKRFLGDSTDCMDKSQDQIKDAICEDKSKMCNSCHSLMIKLEDHWKQFNQIRQDLRIKYSKANRLFSVPNRKQFKKTTKNRKNKLKTIKATKNNSKTKINVPHKSNLNNAIPSNFPYNHEISKPTPSPSFVKIILFKFKF